MPPEFPPKDSKPTPENILWLEKALTAVIVGHPGAIQPWTFYEKIDAYLGPWGDNGYPIGYGKYYCKLFSENPKLHGDPSAKEWVRRTMVLLQEALKTFILNRYRVGTLAKLTERELRDAAFASHAQAYTEGGVAKIALVAPDLIPVIVSIPGKEFNPFAPSFRATINQTIETMYRATPAAIGLGIAALMPAHSGILRNAARLDWDDMILRQNQVHWLNDTAVRISEGKLDNIGVLTEITDRLNATQFEDEMLARRAREIVGLANARKRATAQHYRLLISDNPDLRSHVDKSDPGWSNW